MKTLKSIIILFFTLLLSFSLKAQIQVVTGKVANSKGELPIGNVFLLDTTNKVIKGANLVNGTFEFRDLNHHNLLVKFTSLYFADTTISIAFTGKQQIDMGSIIVKEQLSQINTIEVTGRLPLMRYGNNGNLELNVAGTVLATSSSVNEILSRAPNVVVSEGQISVYGKGEAIIYLNGKLINYEQLAAIPTSQITKIEVIPNPSARYDAAGKAVINIITRLSAQTGINGNISQHVTTSDFFGTNTNTFFDVGYTKSKLAVAANLGLQQGQGRELLTTTRTRADPAEYLKSELTTDWLRNFKPYANYGIGAQYNFSPGTNISAGYSGNSDNLGGTIETANNITTTTRNTYTSSTAKDENRANNSITLNFNRIIDTLGSSLFAGVQYADYKNMLRDHIVEQSMIGGSTGEHYLKSNFDQHLAITSTQLDYTKGFNTKSKLETGAKFSYVTTGSETSFLKTPQRSMPYILDPNMSSSFNYAEKIAALYGSFSTKLNTLNLSVGLRGEYTAYLLESTAAKERQLKDNYIDLFPNLQAELPVSEKTKLRFSYNSRIIRPRYQALNPFVIYQDPFTTIEGNPELVPERARTFEVAATHAGAEFKLSYTYTKDQLRGAAIRGATPESYILKSFNITSDQTFLLSATKPFTIASWWQSINTVSISYSKGEDNQYGFAMVKVSPQIYAYSSNTFSLKNGFKLQLLAWYLGDGYSGIYHEKSRSIITAGIDKTLLNGQLKLGFTANDIFVKQVASGNYNVGRTQIYYHRNYGNKYFKLTASYRFGTGTLGYQSKQTAQQERSRAN